MPGGARELAQDRGRHIGRHVEQHHQAFALAVFGQEAEPAIDRRPGVRRVERLPAERDGAVRPRHRPEQRMRDLRPTGADEAGEPENFARIEIEGDVLHLRRRFEVAHGQHRRGVGVRDRFRRENVLEFAADHHRDERVAIQIGDRPNADQLAVLEHRHAVGDREDLLQPVGDVDDADAVRAQTPGSVEQQLRLAARNHRSRLVEHQKLRIAHQRLCDLDHLLIRDAQLLHQRAGVEMMAEPVERFAGASVHRGVVDQSEPRLRRVAEEDVLRDRQLGEKNEFLVDHMDAGVFRLLGRRPAARDAVEDDLAAIRRVGAGDGLDQCRLAGAVFAEQRVDFAGFRLEIHSVEGFDPRKRLGDAVKRDHRLDPVVSRRRQRARFAEKTPAPKVRAGASSSGRLSSADRPRRWPGRNPAPCRGP